VLSSNENAVRLYESLGFRLRLRTANLVLTSPAPPEPSEVGDEP
jgi:hypothetical protein